MSSVISLENITLRYSRKGPDILKNVSLEVPKGSFCFLTGHSGAGKSTLLKLMYLAHSPTSGKLKLFGDDVTKIPKSKMPFLRRKIGVVFQEYGLISHLSAFDNVALPLRIAGYKEREVKEYVTDLLNWVGLKDFIHSKPSILSGGQQQRISIARAVINRPSILLADEPTGNVDDELAVRLLRLFEELNRSGTTIIIATHSEWLVKRFNYPRLHINKGKLAIVEPDKKKNSTDDANTNTTTSNTPAVQGEKGTTQTQAINSNPNQTPQTSANVKSSLDMNMAPKNPPISRTFSDDIPKDIQTQTQAQAQSQAQPSSSQELSSVQAFTAQAKISQAYSNVEEELLQGNQNLELSLRNNIINKGAQ